MRRVAALVASAAVAVAIPNPEEYVNTLGGTDSRYDLSHGNLLPLVNRPWSFNAWAPMTDNSDGSWWFHPTDARFFGVRCTHQPSPWISDYGNFLIMPSISDPAHGDSGQFSSYIPSDSTWKPYYWNGSLLAYGNRNGLTTVELTSTSHGAVMRVSFPPYVDDALSVGFNQTRRIAVLLNQPYVEAVAVTQGGGGQAPTITGFSAANSGGVAGSLRHYFNMTVTGGMNGDVPVAAFSAGTSMAGTLWAFLDFDPTDPTTQVLTLRVATSLISQAQATVNLAAEIGESSFDEIMVASKAEWRATLSRANVVDVGSAYPAQAANDYLTIFYSSLWRATQFPRKLYEVAANGSAMHWSPYSASNQVFPGPLSADSGFWCVSCGVKQRSAEQTVHSASLAPRWLLRLFRSNHACQS